MATAVFSVGGMSCGGCVKGVTSALQAIAGVSKVDVDLQGGKATVDYDVAQTNPQHLAGAIEEAGFTATCLS